MQHAIAVHLAILAKLEQFLLAHPFVPGIGFAIAAIIKFRQHKKDG